MTFNVDAEAGDLFREESFDSADELCEWIEDFLTENTDEDEFNLVIVRDLQTGDSG